MARLKGREGRLAFLRSVKHQTIQEKVNDTFGDNPCKQLRLRDKQTHQVVIEAQCDTKRCIHCGPRKEMLLWLGLQATFGHHTHIARLPVHEADKAIDAARQRKHRNGTDYTYCIVATGEPQQVFLISDLQLHPDQRFMELDPWRQRITHGYRYGRLRKTVGLFNVTTCPRSRRVTRDIPAAVYYRTTNSQAVWSVDGWNWEQEKAAIAIREVDRWGLHAIPA